MDSSKMFQFSVNHSWSSHLRSFINKSSKMSFAKYRMTCILAGSRLGISLSYGLAAVQMPLWQYITWLI